MIVLCLRMTDSVNHAEGGGGGIEEYMPKVSPGHDVEDERSRASLGQDAPTIQVLSVQRSHVPVCTCFRKMKVPEYPSSEAHMGPELSPL